MTRRVAVLGAGDLGRQLAHYIRSAPELQLVGFFDDHVREDVDGHPVLGGMDEVDALFAAKRFDGLLIGIGYRHLTLRQRLFERFANTVGFETLVHPSAYVDEDAVLEPGTVVFPGCVIDKGVRAGPNSVLNIGCIVAHDSTVGAHSFMGPGVHVAGFVSIGQRCFIGLGSVLIDNITIGDDTQTGGGTVVIKDCEGGVLLVGNPARSV